MSEQSPPDIEAPAVGASVVRYREGWGVLAGSLALLALPGLFLWYLLDPSIRAGQSATGAAWGFFIIFSILVVPLSIGGVIMGVVALARPTALYVDETGIWWDAGTYFAVIRWSGIRSVRGDTSNDPPSVGKKSGSKPGNIEIFFFEGAIEDQHRSLRPIDHEKTSTAQGPPSFGRVFELPNSRTRRRVLAAARSYRPDLIV